MEGDLDVYDYTLVILGIIVTMLGIMQIYFTQKNVSRGNSQKVLLLNLSVADMMDGLIMIFVITSKKVFPYIYPLQGIL